MSDLSPSLLELCQIHFLELNQSSQERDDSWKWPGDPVTSPVLDERWGGRGIRATGELEMKLMTGAAHCAPLQETGLQKREGWEAGSFPLWAHWLCKVMVRLPWFPVRRTLCCPASTATVELRFSWAQQTAAKSRWLCRCWCCAWNDPRWAMMRLSGQDWSTLPRGTRQWIPVLSGVPQKGYPLQKVWDSRSWTKWECICISKSVGVFLYPLSKIRETAELGNHKETVTKSSVDRRNFVAAAHSLYPQTDLIQRNLSTAKPFSWQHPAPFPLCGSTWLQFHAGKMSGLHLSPSFLPVEEANKCLSNEGLTLHSGMCSLCLPLIQVQSYPKCIKTCSLNKARSS